jgi:uncharacterized membrane protein YccC
MNWGLHTNSFRYALALWLATMLALLISFVVQLEPAQWSAITVWIVFIQNPRMNYSKVIWWAFGTITGAFMAVILTVFFNQTPEILLLFLALWLAACSGAAPLLSSYRAYGAVLAGYTCAIVTLSAVDHPDSIFQLAVTRVSCIFIGMTSAIFSIGLLLPKPQHWRETRHQLVIHLKATLQQAAKALNPAAVSPVRFTWRHMVDRLSTLEHTLDITTAETAEARRHAPVARSLVAVLFELLAKAQAVEIHLARRGDRSPADEIKNILHRIQTVLTAFAAAIPAQADETLPLLPADEINGLRQAIASLRPGLAHQVGAEMIANGFLLDQLEEILTVFDLALQDGRGLSETWTARREATLMLHQDYLSAFIYGLRMFLAMGLVSALWFITAWPSGAQLILFTAVVCSLLSLVDHAPLLGFPFLKSAVFCAIMAYVEAFWLFQKGEDFLSLALMLGLFLLPAAYAYRHPRLIGGAVVSMLIFYGLSQPSNQMNYDILAFLNNALALLCAVACGFFAFHAVPSLSAQARQFWLLRAVRKDLAFAGPGALSESRWTSCVFDRLRRLHRAAGESAGATDWLEAENEMLISLQLGLRQRRLHAQLQTQALTPEAAEIVADALMKFREISRHPNIVAFLLRSACIHFEDVVRRQNRLSHQTAGALGEMSEMTFLLETSTRFYTK